MRGLVLSGLPNKLLRGINGVPSAVTGASSPFTRCGAQPNPTAEKAGKNKSGRIELSIVMITLSGSYGLARNLRQFEP
jgi:hypothetical protein